MTATRTTLKARDVMSPEPVNVEPSMTLSQLARVFEENDISGAPVVDEEGRLIGIVSKTDLIRRCTEGTVEVPPAYFFEVLCEQSDEDEQRAPEDQVFVEDIMTEDPVSVGPDTPVAGVAKLMCDGRLHRIVVVDDERFPVGIVTNLDLLRVLAHEK